MKTPYQLVLALYKKYIGDDEKRAEFVTLLRAMNPELIVHVMHRAEPICGRPRPYRGEVWPEDEVWVGIQQPAHVTCSQCVEALRKTA